MIRLIFKKTKKSIRTLTVQDVIIVDSRPCRVYSELRLKGKWLTDAGFLPRSKIQIDVNKKVLIIRPVV